MKAAREAAPKARLFLHPASLAPKFAGNPDGTGRPIGMYEENAKAIRAAANAVVWTSQPTEVLEGVFVTGENPRKNAFEDTGGQFFLDAACTQRDPLMDDQALFLDTTKGLVVLLGCAHAGVVNTLEYIRQLTGGRPIHTPPWPSCGTRSRAAAPPAPWVQTGSSMVFAGFKLVVVIHLRPTPQLHRLHPGTEHCRPLDLVRTAANPSSQPFPARQGFPPLARKNRG